MKDEFGLKETDRILKKTEADLKKNLNFKFNFEKKQKKNKKKKYHSRPASNGTNLKQDIENLKAAGREVKKTAIAFNKVIKKLRGERMPNLDKMTHEEIMELGKKVQKRETEREEREEMKKVIKAHYEALEKERQEKRQASIQKIKNIFKRKDPREGLE